MRHFYSSRRRLTTCSIVASLILQNCTGFVNPSIATEKGQTDNIEKASNQVSISKVRSKKLSHRVSSFQKGDQLQAIGSENVLEGNFPKHQQSGYGYVGKERLKRAVANDQEKVKKKREEGGNRSQTTKRKREKVQEDKQKSQRDKKYLRLENPGKANKQAKEKRKKDRPKIKIQREKKSPIPDSPGATKKRVKKRRKNAKNDTIIELGLLDLPAELLEAIVSYLTFKEAMLARELVRRFYALITGYDKVGIVGAENKPNRPINTATWSLKHYIDFNKLKNKLPSMPSFIFYQLMRNVKNLPQAYWPYLRDTQVQTVNFWRNNIASTEVEILGRCLQSSKVRTLYLWKNQIEDIGAEAFGKTLSENRNIREINLTNNNLSATGAKGFIENLPNKMRKINLGENRIGDEGAIGIAKNVRGKEVEEINLGDNKIGDKGVIGVIENLQGTVVKVLSLGCNKITDEGVMGAAKNIRGTNLEELSLGYNKITNKGAVTIVEYCRGTKMKKLNLSFNRGITDEGAVEIAENIEGTYLEEIDLRQDKSIGVLTQELLKKQCPHIKWIF
ncbi:MAG: hypothetical protein ACYC2U_02820 [Candidatus Amoebophilus sp.]